MKREWQPISSAPKGEVVETKVDDQDGVRRKQELFLEMNLWWFPDRSMYIYYMPTHWRPLPEASK